MAIRPQFIGTPKVWTGQVTTANTNTDGTTGTYATIFTVDAGKTARVEWIRVQALATNTVGNVRLFITDTSAGQTRLIRDVPIAAVTFAEGTALGGADVDYTIYPLILEAGDSLLATTYDGEDYNVVAFGGTF